MGVKLMAAVRIISIATGKEVHACLVEDVQYYLDTSKREGK